LRFGRETIKENLGMEKYAHEWRWAIGVAMARLQDDRRGV
jgi:hypothetical protein